MDNVYTLLADIDDALTEAADALAPTYKCYGLLTFGGAGGIPISVASICGP